MPILGVPMMVPLVGMPVVFSVILSAKTNLIYLAPRGACILQIEKKLTRIRLTTFVAFFPHPRTRPLKPCVCGPLSVHRLTYLMSPKGTVNCYRFGFRGHPAQLTSATGNANGYGFRRQDQVPALGDCPVLRLAQDACRLIPVS